MAAWVQAARRAKQQEFEGIEVTRNFPSVWRRSQNRAGQRRLRGAMAASRWSPFVFNTNRRDDTLECLSRCSTARIQATRVIVLDNQSTDGSVEAVRWPFPMSASLSSTGTWATPATTTSGSGRRSPYGADWVFVLNEDTVLAPECMSARGGGQRRHAHRGRGPHGVSPRRPEVIQSAGGDLTRLWADYHHGRTNRTRATRTRVRCTGSRAAPSWCAAMSSNRSAPSTNVSSTTGKRRNGASRRRQVGASCMCLPPRCGIKASSATTAQSLR